MAQGRNNAGIARRARPLPTRRREAHQLVVLEARPLRGDRGPPPGESRARLPRRPRTSEHGRERYGSRGRLAPPRRDGVAATWARPALRVENGGMSPDPVGVMIVDDQAPFRRAAHMVLAATPGFDVIGEAEIGRRGGGAVRGAGSRAGVDGHQPPGDQRDRSDPPASRPRTPTPPWCCSRPIRRLTCRPVQPIVVPLGTSTKRSSARRSCSTCGRETRRPRRAGTQRVRCAPR